MSENAYGYTPEKVDELVAELLGFAAGSESARATLMRDAAAALTAVSAERDAATNRASQAWEVIHSDYWRNTYDDSMARGNAYVAVMRDRLRAVLKALRQERERAEFYKERAGEFRRKSCELDFNLSRAEETIEKAARLIERNEPWVAHAALTEYDKQKGADRG